MGVSRQVILSEPLASDVAEEFERAVRDHARFVFKIAYAVLRNSHDAEDAVQETFVRCLRHRKRWGEIRNWRAWLARTAWRVALNHKQPRPEVGLDEAAASVRRLITQGSAPDEIAARREMLVLLDQLMAALPADLRNVVRLTSVSELTSRETAELLDIPEGSVRTRLFRARQLLREKLGAVLEKKHGR